MALLTLSVNGIVDDTQAYQQPLQLTQGDNYTIDISVVDADGYAVSISGSVYLTVKQSYTASNTNPIVFAAVATFPTPSTGDGYFTISSANTAALNPNNIYTYDVVYENTGNDVAHIIPVSDLAVVASNFSIGETPTAPIPQPPIPSFPPITQAEPALINIFITGVVQDAYASAAVQPITFTYGDNGDVYIHVEDGYGTPVNLSSSALILTVSKGSMNGDVQYFSREAVITSATTGDGYFIVGTDDTLLLEPSALYTYDVVMIDGYGNIAHIVPVSSFEVFKSNFLFGQSVTVPSTQEPLALGPKGDQGPPGLPDGYFQATAPLTIDGYSSTPVWAAQGTHTIALSGNIVPPVTGHGPLSFLATDGSIMYWDVLTQDQIAPSFSCNLAYGGSNPVEVGFTVVQPAFTASYNRTPAVVTLNDGSGAIGIPLPATSFAYDGNSTLPSRNYQKTTVNQSVTFTLSANESGGPVKTSSRSITWEGRAFYDTKTPPGSLDATFIASLTGQALEPSFARTIIFAAGSNTKKFYYAFPSSFGAPNTFKDFNTGFQVPFSKVASSVNVTNSYSVTIAYDIWASDNFMNASLTVVVS